MPSINQLPAGANGAAALSLAYASISWLCSALMIWLTLVHREGWSFVALTSGFTLLSTTASIMQQIHDITLYMDIVKEQFSRKKTFLEDPELAIANGSFGFDLILYYIQYYSYNVEAMMVMFWAWELAQSIYGLGTNPKMRRALKNMNTAGKTIAVVFPLFTILLLRVPAIRKQFVAFILLADLPLMLSLAIGSGTMVAISCRYINSRKKLTRWTPQNNNTAESMETGTVQSGDARDGTVLSGNTKDGTTMSSSQKPPKKEGLYDRWLMVRFMVAFVVLAIFEVTNTLFQLQSAFNNREDARLEEPDLSADRAKSTMFLFLPGVSPGIFLLVVFGTTTGCRQKMAETFLPKSWRFWQLWRRVPSTIQTQSSQTHQIIFNEEEDIKSLTQNNSLTKSDVQQKDNKNGNHQTNKPLPTLPKPISRYNKDFNSSNNGASQVSTPTVVDRVMEEEAAAIQMQHLRSMEQIRAEYYEPRPEESDDSGPILPIMRTDQRYSRQNVGGGLTIEKSHGRNTSQTRLGYVRWPAA